VFEFLDHLRIWYQLKKLFPSRFSPETVLVLQNESWEKFAKLVDSLSGAET
jgi:hypothetical protein